MQNSDIQVSVCCFSAFPKTHVKDNLHGREEGMTNGSETMMVGTDNSMARMCQSSERERIPTHHYDDSFKGVNWMLEPRMFHCFIHGWQRGRLL